MKGMSSQELEEVRAFVQKHHKFGYVPQEDRLPNIEHGFGIKYIDATYDTRDQTYLNITLRSGSSGVCFATNHWNALNLPPKGWKYGTLYDLTMAYLKGEFVPKEEFYIRDRNPRDEERIAPSPEELEQAINVMVTTTPGVEHNGPQKKAVIDSFTEGVKWMLKRIKNG